MCLLVLAWRTHPRYPLIVAANRDEFHARPAAPLGKWETPADILAGRDLRAGGTWLGLDRRRRFGIITNFRDLQTPKPKAPSRGDLIPDFLAGSQTPQEFLSALEPKAFAYSGFNLLLSDTQNLWYASNRAEGFLRELAPGVHGLSNRFLDTPWPKLLRVRRAFEALADPTSTLFDPASILSPAKLLDMLADRTPAGTDEELPETGLSKEWEQTLSSPFVLHPDFGTRCSTVLLLEASGALQLVERRFDATGNTTGQTLFDLQTGEWI